MPKVDWGRFTNYKAAKLSPDLGFSITDLLKFYDVSLTASGLNQLLEQTDLVHVIDYESSTRPGVMKQRREWSDKGLEYGAMVKTRLKDPYGEMRFRASRFPDLLLIVAQGFVEQARRAQIEQQETMEKIEAAWLALQK